MEHRPLNLTLRSAEGIKTVKKIFCKMHAYADVSIAGYPPSRRRTAVDYNCGSKPRWDCPMEFIVDEPNLTQPGLSLLVEIKAESTLSNDKVVGVVHVPIHELFQSTSADPAEERSVEYQVTTPSGKPRGTLKFSYRFGEKFMQEVNPAAKASAEEPAMAYPPPYAPAGGYPPPYPPPAGYYPPPANPQSSGHGYEAPPPPGYGYPPAAQAPKPKKKKKKKKKKKDLLEIGMSFGAGLIGGLVAGEIADIGEAAAAAYADDAMGDIEIEF